MLTSQTLPITRAQEKLAGAPRLEGLDFTKTGSVVRMAGNGMNLACVGAIQLMCVLGLEQV